ncbi:anti-sigma factor [Saccharicrinis aurantiacus]|uniref:anti-sigma factor n=1 Tax=Saccharicrinis aurantiacus TaxID=1849719 RepID=UPI000950051C|nr:anti-sigma factor [Saccharicrinis aurantiacus]
MKRFRFPLAVLFLSLFIISCDNDDDNDDVMLDNMLTLDIKYLENLGADEVYEGWIVVDGKPVSTGTFTVDDDGKLSKTTFTVDEMYLIAATDFVLSIEPANDDDPAPSAIKILGGSFSESSADVSVSHGAALGSTFKSAAGKYILATPTTNSMEDELSGVWFLSLESGAPAVGLNLPELPSGWAYEGWAVIDGMPVSTGTFTEVDMADNAAPYSGTDNLGPSFPGEDFIQNAPDGLTFPTDLSGTTVVISIEPSPDNSSAPFMFKPLVAPVMEDAMDHKTYDFMNKVAETFPMGTVTR